MRPMVSKTAIRRLHLRPGDFVVVSIPEFDTPRLTQAVYDSFSKWLQENAPGVKVFVDSQSRPLRVIRREIAVRELQLLSAKLPDFEDISNVYHYLEERRKEILGKA